MLNVTVSLFELNLLFQKKSIVCMISNIYVVITFGLSLKSIEFSCSFIFFMEVSISFSQSSLFFISKDIMSFNSLFFSQKDLFLSIIIDLIYSFQQSRLYYSKILSLRFITISPFCNICVQILSIASLIHILNSLKNVLISFSRSLLVDSGSISLII